MVDVLDLSYHRTERLEYYCRAGCFLLGCISLILLTLA